MHNYIFAPIRALWPAAASTHAFRRSRLPIRAGKPVLDEDGKPVNLSASAWLDQYRPVEQMTWAPGLPITIRDRSSLRAAGSSAAASPASTSTARRRSSRATRRRPTAGSITFGSIYPDDADHIIDWLAHRVQRPQEKINHALVLGGQQGIGKDTLLEPVKHAIGPWNFHEVSPTQVLGRFNGFLKSVILRVSEARDLGEFDRFQFYDHMKAYTAAPPDVLRVDEKHLREYAILNCCGVIITTNHKTDGIYLPADDRRHFVAWSCRTKDDRSRTATGQASMLGIATGGMRHVAAFLMQRDISGFDPKAPPPKTPASGRSSMPTARPKNRNWPTSSTGSAILPP